MLQSLELAWEVQQSPLPRTTPCVAGLDAAGPRGQPQRVKSLLDALTPYILKKSQSLNPDSRNR